jgi:hypothetical protein
VLVSSQIDTGSAAISIHGARTDQSIGLGDAANNDMHISDTELLHLTTTGDITFTRFGTGAIVVQSVSRSYSTKPNSIVFGELYADIVTSKFNKAAIKQVPTKSYATTADFAGPDKSVPRLEVSPAVAVGSDIVVKWWPDIYSTRVSHQYDWVGLFRKGECADESVTQSNNIHRCYLGWRYTKPNLLHGEARFRLSEYKVAGEYEVRYFYGSSTDGQGYRCVTLGDTASTYKHCILSARKVSATISVGYTGTATSLRSMPGLIEKVCDGSKHLCE